MFVFYQIVFKVIAVMLTAIIMEILIAQTDPEPVGSGMLPLTDLSAM